MLSRNLYSTGHFDGNIYTFLKKSHASTWKNSKYSLVTCLDSNFDVATLFEKSKHFASLKGRYRTVGDGVLLSTRRLLAAQRESRFFFGFDEVWFFPTPTITRKPEGLIITAPDFIEAAQVEQYSDWLTKNKCYLGLGDGIGTNFLVRISGVARDIVHAVSGRHSSPPGMSNSV